jgi:Uma2 family endonuclease
MGIHDKLVRFLSNWFEAYLETHPIVELREAPFVMRLKTHREPDLQIILHQHLDHLTETYTDGAADLVVEVVSEESIKRDYEDKFKEYAAGGVREYWIIDPLKQEAHFYVLNAEGHYQRVMPDANNSYALSVLPELRLPINLLWTNPLPGPRAIARFLDSSDQ